ncbi:MAG: alpha/beta hydrolase family protein [Solirubrobacteraceae bacterium]
MTSTAEPDARLRGAIGHWASRLIANGVDFNDFRTTTAAIGRWEDWLPAWTRTAESHLALAQEALARDAPHSAGEAYLRAAVAYHFSKFVWMVDLECHRRNTLLAVSTLYEAHRLLDPTAERIEAAIRGPANRRRASDDAGPGMVVANLRRPPGDVPAPLVVLIPGLDSTKEEFFAWESVFLARGLATLSLDGPGQGETGLRLDIRPDYEVAVTAILDALAGREDLDVSRVGAAGVSLGGYYVVRAAAFEPRIAALASISGPYDFGAEWDSLPEVTRETVIHHTGASGPGEARARAAELNLDGVAELVRAPCMVMTGRLDRVLAWEQTKRIADAIPGSEWVLYDDATHVCNNVPFRYRPLVADWLGAHLRAT